MADTEYSPETYDHYLDRLAGKDVPLNADVPHLGFYRMRRREKMGPVTFIPVAYFMEDGFMACLVDDKPYTSRSKTDDIRMREIWPSCEPIPEDMWRDVAEAGKPWPDVDPHVLAEGQNIKPGDDVAALSDQIDSALKGLVDYKDGITSDEQRDRAQTLRSRLLELYRTADKKRESEKAPHLEAGRKVDVVWQPIVKRAKAGADSLSSAMSRWETEKARREAARRAEAEAAGAPPPTASAPPAPVQGAYGRAAAVVTVKIAKIVDQDQVYEYFKKYASVADLLLNLAQHAIRDGHTIPGVEVVEEKRVR